MAFKSAYCAGHALTTPGKETPDKEKEWSFNNKVVLAFEDEMRKYQNVELLRTDDPTGKRDVPLKERTGRANAWGADLYISFHHNAFQGKWGNHTGVGTFVYKTKPKEAVRLAKIIQPKLVQAYGLRDRGITYNNLHINREANMTSVLLEGGFMDSVIDIKKLRDDKVLDKVGRSVAHAVAEFAGLKLKAQPKPAPTPANDVYTVQAGDTLWRIATDNGMTVKELKDLNGLKNDLIHPGDKLKLKKAASEPPKKEESKAEKYTLVTSVKGYYYAADAKARRDDRTLVARGTYYVYSRSDDMINVTTKLGVPGSWINPADNKTADFKVGQRVKVKSSARKYATGQNIPDWVKGRTYTIQQIKSDRVLLKEITSWVYKKDVE